MKLLFGVIYIAYLIIVSYINFFKFIQFFSRNIIKSWYRTLEVKGIITFDIILTINAIRRMSVINWIHTFCIANTPPVIIQRMINI